MAPPSKPIQALLVSLSLSLSLLPSKVWAWRKIATCKVHWLKLIARTFLLSKWYVSIDSSLIFIRGVNIFVEPSLKCRVIRFTAGKSKLLHLHITFIFLTTNLTRNNRFAFKTWWLVKDNTVLLSDLFVWYKKFDSYNLCFRSKDYIFDND